jgi:hypothetical protein
MAIINDGLYWFFNSPPIHWLSQQPVGFGLFGAAFAAFLIVGCRGMRGPEV